MDTFAIIVLVAVGIAACVFVYKGIQKTLNETDKPTPKPKRVKK